MAIKAGGSPAEKDREISAAYAELKRAETALADLVAITRSSHERGVDIAKILEHLATREDFAGTAYMQGHLLEKPPKRIEELLERLHEEAMEWRTQKKKGQRERGSPPDVFELWLRGLDLERSAQPAISAPRQHHLPSADDAVDFDQPNPPVDVRGILRPNANCFAVLDSDFDDENQPAWLRQTILGDKSADEDLADYSDGPDDTSPVAESRALSPQLSEASEASEVRDRALPEVRIPFFSRAA